MRHQKKSEKFSRNRAQRKALVKSLLRALFTYERIKTTESKAKGIRPWVDRLITLAKNDTLHARRLAYKWLPDHLLVKRLFEQIAPRFKDTPGGYTRIIDIGYRAGDAAKISLMELTKLGEKKITAKAKKTKSKTEKTESAETTQETTSQKENPKTGLIAGMKKIFKKKKE